MGIVYMDMTMGDCLVHLPSATSNLLKNQVGQMQRFVEMEANNSNEFF